MNGGSGRGLIKGFSVFVVIKPPRELNLDSCDTYIPFLTLGERGH